METDIDWDDVKRRMNVAEEHVDESHGENVCRSVYLGKAWDLAPSGTYMSDSDEDADYWDALDSEAESHGCYITHGDDPTDVYVEEVVESYDAPKVPRKRIEKLLNVWNRKFTTKFDKANRSLQDLWTAADEFQMLCDDDDVTEKEARKVQKHTKRLKFDKETLERIEQWNDGYFDIGGWGMEVKAPENRESVLDTGVHELTEIGDDDAVTHGWLEDFWEDYGDVTIMATLVFTTAGIAVWALKAGGK